MARLSEPIAIVGLSCRFPKADDPRAFWRLLVNELDAISETPADRGASQKHRWGGFIEHVGEFDAGFFGISPREASEMHAVQGLLLELAWEALDDSGLIPHNLRNSRTGVFLGLASHNLAKSNSNAATNGGLFNVTGSGLSIAANRISYFFDFKGPSLVVDTATSSSAVAIDLACRSLSDGECTLALTGGANMISPDVSEDLAQAGMLASDGRCKPFDAKADGYVRGEGGGLLVLKRLSDAIASQDRIYAIIRGAAVNQDGATSGLTVPNQSAQEELLRLSYDNCGIEPHDIQYVEAHGSGTPLGDPIEASALAAVFAGRTAESPLLIGSVKTNIGHLEGAAGIAGVIKVALSLHHAKIPSTLHFSNPNPRIDFSRNALRVVCQNSDWPHASKIPTAGVSSFGLGGTNAHIVLQQAPQESRSAEAGSRDYQILPISAHSHRALKKQMLAYRDQLLNAESATVRLADLVYTASCRRMHHKRRVAVVAASTTEAAGRLTELLNDFEEFLKRCSELTALDDLECASIENNNEASEDQLQELANSYMRGYNVNFARLHPEGGNIVSLPVYQWDRKRHWQQNSSVPVDQPRQSFEDSRRSATFTRTTSELDRYVYDQLKLVLKTPRNLEIDADKTFFELGMNSLMLTEFTQRLKRGLGDDIHLSPMHFFDYPLPNLLCEFLAQQMTSLPTRATCEHPTSPTREPIAIIGLGCRFPGGANSPALFWQMLRDGVDAAGPIPPTRWNVDEFYDSNPDAPGKLYVREGSFLNTPIDQFDADFFSISPREAEWMDPRQRILLEVVWEALEDSAIDPARLRGTKTGIFIGAFKNDYELLINRHTDVRDLAAHWGTGNADSLLAGRLAYFLGTQGPAWTVDTACSASLVAVHNACNSLLSGESDCAIAAGINLLLSPEPFINFCKANMLAPDGRCKTFDAAANGYARAEGCGVVLLKRLSEAQRDGDRILALIRGSVVNQDGASNSLTAPNGLAQQELLRSALRVAELQPSDIDAIEAHGTGTALGDPIEVNAIQAVYAGDRQRTDALILSSVKTSVGHLEAAAGIAGLIKTVLALQNEFIPPHLHLKELNPLLDLPSIPATIPTAGVQWLNRPERVRRAGVSAFGFSGTNTHLIVEEAPPSPPIEPDKQPYLVALSAKTPESLRKLCSEYLHLLRTDRSINLSDLSFTANTGRTHWQHRIALIASDTSDLAEQLQATVSSWSSDRIADRGENLGLPKIERADVATVRELSEIAQLYQNGVDIDWPSLYQQGRHKKVSLPTYQFDRKRYWLKALDEAMQKGVNAQIADYTYQLDWILDRQLRTATTSEREISNCRPENPGDVILKQSETVSELNRDFNLQQELNSISLEFARRALIELGLDADRTHSDVSATCVQLSIVPNQRRLAERLLVLIQHAALTPVDIDTSLARLRQTYPDSSEQISVVERCGNELARLLRGQQDALTLLFPQDGSPSVEAWYRKAPPIRFGNKVIAETISTIAAQTKQPLHVLEIGAGTGSTTDVILPHLPERCEYVFSDVSSLFLNRARTRYTNNPSIRVQLLDIEKDPRQQGFAPGHFDIIVASNVLHATTDLNQTLQHIHHLLAPGGQLLLLEVTEEQTWLLITFGLLPGWWKFDDFELRPGQPLLSVPLWQQLLEKTFSDVQLIPIGAGNASQCVISASGRSVQTKQTAERWIVYGDRTAVDESLAERLLSSGAQVAVVQNGPLHSPTETLAPDAITGIVFCAALDAGSDSIRENQQKICTNALHVIQSIGKLRLPNPPRIIFVTQGVFCLDDQKQISPFQATISGLAKSAAVEFPNITCRVVDLDPHYSVDQSAAQLFQELWITDNEVTTALRHGSRYIQRLRKAPIVSTDTSPKSLAGTCLITGGLGGIGGELVEWLVERGAKSIALLGRSEPSVDALAHINQLRATGCCINIFSVDIGDRECLEQTLATIKRTMPPLKTVFQVAGCMSSATLMNQSWSRFAETFESKVFGSWNLHELTLDEDLDHFVLFSSSASLYAQPGLASYIAANSFLDSLAHYRKSINKPALVINWGVWSKTGVSIREEVRRASEQSGLRDFTPRIALAALRSYMSNDGVTQVAFVDADWNKGKSTHPIIDRLITHNVSYNQLQHFEPSTSGRSARESTSIIEEHLRSTLALPRHIEIDHQRGFFDMGMDSLMAVEFANRIRNAFEANSGVSAVTIFDYPSVERLNSYLQAQVESSRTEAKLPDERKPSEADDDIVIVGLSCRFPGGANNPALFWNLLEHGADAIGPVPEDRWSEDEFYNPDPASPGRMYVKDGGFLNVPIDRFDNEFFGISGREAEWIDPQQRLLLEVTWEALENAAIDPATLRGSKTGIFIGAGLNDYGQLINERRNPDDFSAYFTTGNLGSVLAGRLAYTLGAEGPSIVVDTACSSSLVAVHTACQSLKNNESDCAIVGGVNIILAPQVTINYCKANMLSADGRCKTFDASADGFGRGEGCGVVVLKRMSRAVRDGDRILAVIRASCINQDGASSGLTVPNGVSQEKLLRAALHQGGLAPSDIDVIEAHGTGTPLGDPIEVNSLGKVFSETQIEREPLVIGSVKTNIGHLEAASGIAGLIKVVLSLEKETIPPHLHFSVANPLIDLERIPAVVPASKLPWCRRPGRTRRAGVSSFGLSGTNAHIIVEEAPNEEVLRR
ncbi:MAG TPA: SDR family NAD(P)-dependent oxidoreductase [Planktothrix sp.]